MGKGENLSYSAMGWFILAEAMIFVASGITVYGCFLLGECLGRNSLFGYDVDDPDSVYSPSHYQ